MKTKQSKGIFWIALAAAVALLAACEGPAGPKGDKGADGDTGEQGLQGPAGPVYIYTVSYDIGDGTRIGGDIASQQVVQGGKVAMPLRAPTNEIKGADGGLDYLEPGLYATVNQNLAQPFEAWDSVEYEEDGITLRYREWDFDNDVVTSNVKLRARYGQPVAEVLGAGWIPATDQGFPAAAFNHINNPQRAGEYTLILPGQAVDTDGVPLYEIGGVSVPKTDAEYAALPDPKPDPTPMVYTGALPQLTQQNINLYIRSRGIGGTPPVAEVKDAEDNVIVSPMAGILPTPAVVTFAKPSTAGSVLLRVGADGDGSGSNVRVTIGRNIVLQGSTNNRPAVIISGGGTLVMEGLNEPAGLGPYAFNAPKITGNTNTSTTGSFRDTSATSTGAAVGVYSGTLIMRGDSIITGNNAGGATSSSSGFAGIGWYGFRTSGVFVYRWGTLRMEGNARIDQNHYQYADLATAATNAASSTEATRRAALLVLGTSDVFIDKINSATVTPRGTLNMSGNAHIGILSLADYGGTANTNTTFVSISGAMSGSIPIRVNLWREEQAPSGAGGANFWQVGTPILRGVGGYAVALTDAQRFALQLRTGWYNDATPRQANGGFAIGTSGNATLETKN
jgi:hypothetical protein